MAANGLDAMYVSKSLTFGEGDGGYTIENTNASSSSQWTSGDFALMMENSYGHRLFIR